MADTGTVVTFTARILVDAEAGEVFDVLTDWPRQSAWVPATVVRRLPGPVAQPGERFVARSGVGPLVLVDPMTVRRYQPPTADWPGAVDIVKTGHVLRGSVSIAVRAVGGGTSQVSWTERIDVLPRLFSAAAAAGGPVPRWFGTLAFSRVLRTMVAAEFGPRTQDGRPAATQRPGQPPGVAG